METRLELERAAAPRTRLVTRDFLLVMASTFAYFLAIGISLPVLPRFVEGPLDGGSVGVGIAIGSFAIAAVLVRPPIGVVGDLRGRRVLILVGGVAVGVSILGYALASSLVVLIFFRLISGAGEAAFYVGAASVINDISPDERRGEAFSYFSLALFGGLALGPVIGELVLEATGFDVVWLVAGSFALVAGAMSFVIPETMPPVADAPPRRQLVHRAAILPGIVLSTNVWGLASFLTFVPLYALDLGLSGSRFVFAMHSIIIFCIRAFGAQIPDRLGPRRSAQSALTCTFIGFAVMALWGSSSGLYVGAAIYSVGHALLFPALMTLAVSRAPVSERASVVSTFTAFFDASFGLGALSAGAVAAAVGYRGAFAVSSAVALSGIALMVVRAGRARSAVASA